MAYRFVEPRTRVGDGIEKFSGAKLFFFDFGTTNPKITHSDFALVTPNSDPVVADSDGLFPNIFLDIQASVTLERSNATVVYGPEKIYAPEDGITALDAANVAVIDAAGNFAATDVELVLKELSDDWAKLGRINTFTAVQTFTDALQISDQELRRALLLDYAIVHNDISSVSGVLTLDLTTGNSFGVVLDENITSIVIDFPPPTGRYGQFVLTLVQDGAGMAYTVAWPDIVLFPGGTDPVMSPVNNAIDEVTCRTQDFGTQWRGSFSQAFA